MNLCKIFRCPSLAVIAIGVLAFGVIASGAPGDYDQLAADIQANLTKGKVVKILPPISGEFQIPLRLGKRAEGIEPFAVGEPIPVVQIINDGNAASTVDWGALAPIYMQWDESGYYYSTGGGPWAMAANLDPYSFFGAPNFRNPLPLPYAGYWDTNYAKTIGGGFQADLLYWGNGFLPGGSIVGYDVQIAVHSRYSPDATVTTALWDGDPWGVEDTACSDPVTGPKPIPGTSYTWVDLPGGYLYTLSARLKDKAVINCDHAWMVMNFDDGCYVGRAIPMTVLGLPNAGPTVGSGDGAAFLIDCGQWQACGANEDQYNVGTCCVDGVTACDHTDGTIECLHARNCKDEWTEYMDLWYSQQYGPYYNQFMTAVYAQANVFVSIVPAEAHLKPGDINGDSVGTIDGDTIHLAKGGANVWMELRVSDFDPDDLGVQVSSWGINLDRDSFGSGLGATLVPKEDISCQTNGDCETALGPGALCALPTDAPVRCAANMIDASDYCYVAPGDTPGVDPIDYRFGGIYLSGGPANEAATCSNSPNLCCRTTTDCIVQGDFTSTCTGPFPGYMTAGRMVLEVPDDAKGTYEITANFAEFIDGTGTAAIPLVGIFPGYISVDVGQCCFGVGADAKKQGCVDSITVNQCMEVGLCKGVCTSNQADCTSDANCPGGTGDCVGGATLGWACMADGGKDWTCEGPDRCVLQGQNFFRAGFSCADPCDECTVDAECDDGDACTTDTCDTAAHPYLCGHTAVDCNDGLYCTVDGCDPDAVVTWPADGCTHDPLLVADGLGCTDDWCDEVNDVVVHQKIDCTDTDPCTVDKCLEPNGTCENTSLDVLPHQYVCPSGDVNIDCQGTVDQYTGAMVATTCAPDATGISYCRCSVCSTKVACEDPTACRATLSVVIDDDDNCIEKGSKLLVYVHKEPGGNPVPATIPIAGVQFVLYYDPACLDFNSISGVAPYVLELYEDVDEAAGEIIYAVGVEDVGDAVGGAADMAVISFNMTHGCNVCANPLTFGGANPYNTYFSDDTGQRVCADTVDGKQIHELDVVSLTVPDNFDVNVDCEQATATVLWDAPTASSSCYDPDCDPTQEKCYEVNLECNGWHPGKDGLPQTDDDINLDAVAMTGGEFPIGVSHFACSAFSKLCGQKETAYWTVTVSDAHTIDVTIQLEPVILADNLVRCIKFEVFPDTIQDPLVFEEDILFGGLYDYVGHFTAPVKTETGVGNIGCITARDQYHTLRACAWMLDGSLYCGDDGIYHATFKGDPFFGGNWLIGGNLDGYKKHNPYASHDVIDILDFGQFIANVGGDPIDPNTPCGWDDPADPQDMIAHADIDGDGLVGPLDFAFISLNFFVSSKDCCAGGPAGTTVGRSEVSLRELRQMGLGELGVADLNNDGLLNEADMAAYQAGQRPVKKAPARSLRSSR